MVGGDGASDDRKLRLGVLAGMGTVGVSGTETDSAFGGVYGHVAFTDVLFGDFLVLGGYGDGGQQTRLRANNLVTGGVEQIAGGTASGAFANVSGRLGAYIPMDSFILAPSVRLGYAQQWRQGYVESGAGGMGVGAYDVGVITTRLELAALMGASDDTTTWQAVLRGGLDVTADVSAQLSLTMGGQTQNVSQSFGTRIDGYVGAGFSLALNDALTLKLDSEATFGDNRLGGVVRASVGASF